VGSPGKPYRTFTVSGFEILVGKGDAENDSLTFEVAEPQDVWFHVGGVPGSHVILRNPEGLPDLPKEVVRRAAELAAFYSKARGSGRKVPVHACFVRDVSKSRGAPAGEVTIRGERTHFVYPREADPVES
jgi:predicted ribosome quality control (RQC) complex YloA/Tae2 family protein